MSNTVYYGVYKVTRGGKMLHYVPRSATHSEKLAREIAEGLSRGEVVMPDGRIKPCEGLPHIHKPIGKAEG